MCWMDGRMDGCMDGWMDVLPGHQLRPHKAFASSPCYFFSHACRHGTQTLKEGLWGLINKTEVINFASQ